MAQFPAYRRTPGYPAERVGRRPRCGRQAQFHGDAAVGGGGYYARELPGGALTGVERLWCPWETWDNREAVARQGLSMLDYLNERRIDALVQEWARLRPAERLALAGDRADDIHEALAEWSNRYPFDRWEVVWPAGSHYNDQPLWTMATSAPVTWPAHQHLLRTVPLGAMPAAQNANVFATATLEQLFAGPWLDEFVASLARPPRTLGERIAANNKKAPVLIPRPPSESAALPLGDATVRSSPPDTSGGGWPWAPAVLGVAAGIAAALYLRHR